MFTLQTFTSILAILSFSVRAFPLSQRDVVAPKIIKPDASSVWPVGTQQIVIWDTSNFPSQITNPIGQIILGFNESDSLNLDFNNPLAQGFKLTDGNVTLTVPNVPPRDDYIIVLFGDSGDTSPAFAITRISSPGPDTLSSSASSGSIPGTTLPATSLSIPGSVITPTSTGNTLTAVVASTAAPPTGTTTTGSTSSSSISNSNSNSNSASAVTSASDASSSTSAGWSLHRGGNRWSSAAPFLMGVAPFVVVFMV